MQSASKYKKPSFTLVVISDSCIDRSEIRFIVHISKPVCQLQSPVLEHKLIVSLANYAHLARFNFFQKSSEGTERFKHFSFVKTLTTNEALRGILSCRPYP